MVMAVVAVMVKVTLTWLRLCSHCYPCSYSLSYSSSHSHSRSYSYSYSYSPSYASFY